MKRLRVLMPSHELEQADQVDHDDNLQSQARVLHLRVCDTSSHKPGTMFSMLRVCFCTPPPHLREHLDHALQAEICPHSSGQAPVPHLRRRIKLGHVRPPLDGTTRIERLLDCTPPPQRTEQCEYELHSETLQLQGFEWHVRTSVVF
jgi:hypothetical protein